VFITSYTEPIPSYVKGVTGPGISFCRWYENGLRLEIVSTDEKGNPNPSSMCFGPDGKTLLVGSEEGESCLPFLGKVSSFAIETGGLSFINQQPTNGNATCYLARRGQHLYVANYNLGSVASFPLRSDGSLSEATTLNHLQFWKQSRVANQIRQGDGAHAHCAVLDNSKKFLFSCDLGCDLIVQYCVQDNGYLQLNNVPFVSTAPGAGPRHLFFHPTLPIAYVSNELNCTIAVYQLNTDTGTLSAIQVLGTLHTDIDVPTYSTSHVEVHPSGKFVVVANRSHGKIGDDSIALFPIDPTTGRVAKPVFGQAEGVSVFRHFSFDPSGTMIFVACQDSGQVAIFTIEPIVWRLRCVKLVPWKGAPNFILFAR